MQSLHCIDATIIPSVSLYVVALCMTYGNAQPRVPSSYSILHPTTSTLVLCVYGTFPQTHSVAHCLWQRFETLFAMSRCFSHELVRVTLCVAGYVAPVTMSCAHQEIGTVDTHYLYINVRITPARAWLSLAICTYTYARALCTQLG